MSKLILLKKHSTKWWEGRAGDSPKTVLGGLRILGIHYRRGTLLHQDKEFMLFDAKAAFRVLARRYHSDLGGTDAQMRVVLEAFRLVKRYCTRTPQVVPSDPRYEERQARRDVLSQL